MNLLGRSSTWISPRDLSSVRRYCACLLVKHSLEMIRLSETCTWFKTSDCCLELISKSKSLCWRCDSLELHSAGSISLKSEFEVREATSAMELSCEFCVDGSRLSDSSVFSGNWRWWYWKKSIPPIQVSECVTVVWCVDNQSPQYSQFMTVFEPSYRLSRSWRWYGD